MRTLVKFIAFPVIGIFSGICSDDPEDVSGNVIENYEQNMKDTATHKHTNHLINETSPYLLQHAYNPVDWFPWGSEALEKAKRENKLLLVSIGYSACHWCHVMERESFEDEEVAKVMNENFISIKVDREERPDIDQIYMDAVQLMSGSGGWPLNCFALPDGRPFVGGTYFPKDRWVQLLQQVSQEYRQNPGKCTEYAEKLTHGIRQNELVPMNKDKSDFSMNDLTMMAEPWKKNLDNKEGGPNRAPKFPMPNNYQFLLRYAHHAPDKEILDHVKITLNKMAFGGIYDHVGGGFARYSTDIFWKVPHFEKMLYDNAQLISLYSEAYQKTKDPLYKKVVYECLEYIKREMTGDIGEFYSALDADSEGEEGKYYIWKNEELKNIIGSDYELFADYYNVNQLGLWEDGNYILLRDKSDDAVAKKHGITTEALNVKISSSKEKLLKVRSKRIKPGLDDKCLTSWNALMLKGYVDAYNIFDEKEFIDAALKNANFIAGKMKREDGGLWHSYKKGESRINGFLEDYAFTAEAFIALYEATFDEKWLLTAKQLIDFAIAHFFDDKSGLFWFTSDIDPPLAARKMELTDNVIPGSNSAMAKALHLLGMYYDNNDFSEKARQMLSNIRQYMPRYGSGYSNWGQLMLNMTNPFYEVAIVGYDAAAKRREMNSYYIPNKIYLGSTVESNLPLLKNKFAEGKTMIYVCVNKTCKLPVEEVKKAVIQLGFEN